MTIQEMNNNPMTMITNLVDQYHANPDSFTEDQAEKLALIAFETNTPFRPETKKLKKFFFDLADTALLCLIPNELRPKRVGEDLYGESTGENIVGGAGSLLGLATGIGGAYGIGKRALPKAKTALSDAVEGFKTVGREQSRRMNPLDLRGVGNVGVSF